MTGIFKKTILLQAFALFTLWGISQENQPGRFFPGEKWPDNNGDHINAHGGGLLFYEGTWYWYGEHKIAGPAGNTAQVGVSVYSSTDLCQWKNEGIALRVSDDPSSLIVKGCVIERPKVLYNPKNGNFVMWFHHELKGMGYKAAKTGVAVAASPTGPFSYLGSVNPNPGIWPLNFSREQQEREYAAPMKDWSEEWVKAVRDGLFVKRDFSKGQMARDMALFIDDDGKAYHIHASEENLTLHIAELNDDFTGFTGKYVRVMPGGHNEAPALFKKDGKYYMVTSGCTGWAPNAARSAVATHIFGPWEELGNPCTGEGAQLTFNSQSTFILPVPGNDNQWIFMADRWNPKNPIDGRYVWLPLVLENGKPVIRWKDDWQMDSPEIPKQ